MSAIYPFCVSPEKNSNRKEGNKEMKIEVNVTRCILINTVDCILSHNARYRLYICVCTYSSV